MWFHGKCRVTSLRKERKVSVENVKAFFAKMEGDKALREKFESMVQRMRKGALGEVVKMASAAGYKFTAADLAEARKATVGALSEDELKQVAGGGDARGPMAPRIPW